MQGLWRLWGFFCWKATKSRSLISNFSFQILVGLTILGKHLSMQTWYRKLLASNRIEYHKCSTSYSMWQRDQAVSKSVRGGIVRTEFQSLQGKPNTHAWSTVESLPSNRLILILGHGSASLSPTTENRSSLHPWFIVQHRINFSYKLTSYLYERVGGMSICRADQLLGLPRTIFTACG